MTRAALLGAAILALGACGSDAQERRSAPPGQDVPATAEQRPAPQSPPPKPLSADAEAPTGEKVKDKDKEPRANTPPGMDRAGGGPASGAIVDPTGAATK